MRYIEQHKLTEKKSGGVEKFLGFLFIVGLLAMMGIAGAIETQAEPTCEDYQAAQDWQRALHNGCPFTDENGDYLYTWTP